MEKFLAEGGLKLVTQSGLRQIYLLTDGESKVDWKRTRSTIDMLDASNVELHIVYVACCLSLRHRRLSARS